MLRPISRNPIFSAGPMCATVHCANRMTCQRNGAQCEIGRRRKWSTFGEHAAGRRVLEHSDAWCNQFPSPLPDALTCPNSSPKSKRDAPLVVWLVLVAATIVSSTVGVNHGIDHRLSTALVLVVTVVKANLVGMNFMELREAVLPLRAIFNTFCIVACVSLIAMYLTNA